MTRAAVLHEQGGPVRVTDVDLAPTGPGLVRVRLLAAGVCHSDLSLANGGLRQQTPAVLGHEACAEVVETGDGVDRVRPGDRVVLVWSPPCHACRACLRGEPFLCEHPAQADPYASLADGTPVQPGLGVGGFAEETLVPQTGVVRVPADTPPHVAALAGCAVTTGVGAVLNVARTRPGDAVAVVGCGGVGLSVVQAARYAGATLVAAVDPMPQRRAKAAALGATDTHDGSDTETWLRDLTGRRGVDAAFEAVGSAATIRTAYRVTRRGGIAVVVGAGRRDEKVEFSALELFHQARRLVGTVYGNADPDVDVPRVLDLWRAGALDLESLVSHTGGLDGTQDALDRLARGEGARTVLTLA